MRGVGCGGWREGGGLLCLLAIGRCGGFLSNAWCEVDEFGEWLLAGRPGDDLNGHNCCNSHHPRTVLYMSPFDILYYMRVRINIVNIEDVLQLAKILKTYKKSSRPINRQPGLTSAHGVT